jgi:hypothetical protein
MEAATAPKPKFKFPKALGACADRLFTVRQQRLEIQKQVDLLQSEESAIKEHIINTLPKSEASGVAGKLARVTVVSKQVPQVKDWDAFYKHVKKSGDFDLLQRRLTDSAIKERWEAGKEVPGVEHFNAISVSINKV